jgi:hypothetical protein
VRVEREIAAHSVALAAIPPVIKGADAKPFNPRGEWQAGMIANSLDVVSYNGSSYISNEDGNTEKPTRSTKYTTLAKRSGNGAGGATDFGSLTGTILPAQVVPGSATYAVGDVLYAGTTGALSNLAAGTSGQLLSTQGAGAAPIWVSATGGAGDVNGPGSATDNAIVRFDGTGGKTVQNSTVIVGDTGAITGVESLKSSTSGGLAIIGSGGTTVATFGPGAGTGVAFNSSGLTGVNSVTAASATDLTLSGGSTGASLVLGQGTTAANATIVPKGTGSIGLATASATLYGKVATALATATSPATIAGSSFDATYATFGGVTAASASTFGIGVTSGGTSGTNLLSLAAGSDWLDINYYGLNHKFFGTAAEKARFTSTGNLLIGTTTDAASLAGGLVVNGSGAGATSSSTSTGALRVTGGVGVSGAMNVGGGATFAGAVTVAGTVIHTLSATPASASATGTVGTMSWDANYIYICTATNTWKRVAIATW